MIQICENNIFSDLVIPNLHGEKIVRRCTTVSIISCANLKKILLWENYGGPPGLLP